MNPVSLLTGLIVTAVMYTALGQAGFFIGAIATAFVAIVYSFLNPSGDAKLDKDRTPPPR